MSMKRILRWGVVLFLLAALPGLTVALAQGQEPPEKQLPVVNEMNESLMPAASNLTESEPNNTFGTADVMALHDSMAGKINPAGDVDYFKFQVEVVDAAANAGQEVLINIDAAINGSPLDSVLTLYDASFNVVASNDDSDGVDSLVYYKLLPGWYYIEVKDYGSPDGGTNYTYDLILSRVILVSAHAQNLGTGNVAGIPFQAGDILAQTSYGPNNTVKWVMFFDISDLGTTKNVDKIATLNNDDDILIGFPVNVTLPGTNIVSKPWDMVRFTPGQYGGYTSGTFSLFLVGAGHQLTTSSEKIDAISDWTLGPAGNQCQGYPVSTTGAATVNKVGGGTFKAADEDVFCKQALGGFGLWKPFIDGSLIGGLAAEDIIAFDYNERMDTGYFVILGTGVIGGTPVNQKQILSLYPNPPGWRFISWDGPSLGWNYNLDAIDVTGY